MCAFSFPRLAAAQCGHAVYGLAKKLQKSSPETLRQWESCGQAKIALRADGGVPQMVNVVNVLEYYLRQTVLRRIVSSSIELLTSQTEFCRRNWRDSPPRRTSLAILCLTRVKINARLACDALLIVISKLPDFTGWSTALSILSPRIARALSQGSHRETDFDYICCCRRF